MSWSIPKTERTYLRKLARKQAEYAALPVMAQRRKMWYDLNDGVPNARPPVVIETATFDRDFMPESVYQCKSKDGRAIERQLLRNVREHELIDDDKVTPDAFTMGWITSIDTLGLTIGRETVKDAQGVATGYRWLHPIKDIRRDLDLLKPATHSVDRESTKAYKAFLEELFDGALPVRMAGGVHAHSMLTHTVVALMGMEAFFMAMYDAPDETHRLMARLRDNILSVMRWAEAEGLLILNNENHVSFGSSFNFTRRLPAPDYKGGPVRLCDMWGASNSQETVGVSASMFHEFCFPYYRAVCEPVGLLYYGCCEPAHPFWEDLRQLPHLKKISISRWCDQRFMADALRGTGIVFSRKPDPNFLSVDAVLNEEAWAAHIRETLDIARGIPVEFIVRDVYTVQNNLNNPRRAVEIARKEVDRQF